MNETDPHWTHPIEREGELIDLSDAATLATWLVSSAVTGVVGNFAWEAVRTYFQRTGGDATLRLAAETLRQLRIAEPYTPEEALRTRVRTMFHTSGLSLIETDLPAAPPVHARLWGRSVPPGGPWDAFLAYAGPDRPMALGLHARLRDRGLAAFLDCRDLAATAVWPVALPAALANSRRVVFLLSSHTSAAWYQMDEVARAVERIRDGRIEGVVVHLGPRPKTLDDVPYGLAPLQSLCVPELGSLDAIADILATL
jgi:hypothetical protein